MRTRTLARSPSHPHRPHSILHSAKLPCPSDAQATAATSFTAEEDIEHIWMTKRAVRSGRPPARPWLRSSPAPRATGGVGGGRSCGALHAMQRPRRGGPAGGWGRRTGKEGRRMGRTQRWGGRLLAPPWPRPRSAAPRPRWRARQTPSSGQPQRRWVGAAAVNLTRERRGQPVGFGYRAEEASVWRRCAAD